MRVEVLRRIEEIESLEKDWSRLHQASHGAVFSSFHWSHIWLKHFGDVAPPRVITLSEGDEMVGIAPCVSYRGSLRGYPLHYLCLAGNVGETTEFHDLAFLRADESPRMLDAFALGLRKASWNLLELRDLRWDGFASALYGRLSRDWPCQDIVSKPVPRAPLDPDKDPIEQYEVRTGRKVRRIIDQLDKERRIGYRIARTEEQVAASVDIYLEQHRRRWASKGGSIYNDPVQASFLKEITTDCARRGETAVYEILIDGKVASQQLCIHEGKVLHMYKIGMDDQFRAFAPGFLSVYFAMNEARLAGFTEFDLGPGPEEYKYKVGGRDRFTHNIQGKRGNIVLLSKASRLPVLRTLRRGIEPKASPASSTEPGRPEEPQGNPHEQGRSGNQ